MARWKRLRASCHESFIAPFDYAAILDGHVDDNWIRRSSAEPWRGPHQHKELSMMLMGKKPAAYLQGARVIRQAKIFAEHGLLVWKTAPSRVHGGAIFAATPEHAYRLARLKRLIEDKPYEYRHSYHARLGILFGYSKNQIRAFYEYTESSRLARSVVHAGRLAG